MVRVLAHLCGYSVSLPVFKQWHCRIHCCISMIATPHIYVSFTVQQLTNCAKFGSSRWILTCLEVSMFQTIRSGLFSQFHLLRATLHQAEMNYRQAPYSRAPQRREWDGLNEDGLFCWANTFASCAFASK